MYTNYARSRRPIAHSATYKHMQHVHPAIPCCFVSHEAKVGLVLPHLCMPLLAKRQQHKQQPPYIPSW